MSEINSTSSNRQAISVTDDGLFRVKGRVVDVIGLIFQIQSETKDFAQKHLELTAQELWNMNQKSKKLVYLLDQVRALRPTGDADAKVEGSKLDDLVVSYNEKYGGNPFYEFNVASLAKVSFTRKTTDGKNLSDLDSKEISKAYSSYSVYSKFMPKGHETDDQLSLVGSITGDKDFKSVLSFDKMKQAEVDQLIEGIKSQISTVSSSQELLNNDTQKYSRLSDETKEAMAAIEKAIDSTRISEESKI